MTIKRSLHATVLSASLSLLVASLATAQTQDQPPTTPATAPAQEEAKPSNGALVVKPKGSAPAKKAAAVVASDTKKESLGQSIQFKVDKYILPNGLTVLLHEDHAAPIVSYQTWFRVGSKNEHPGTTGIAHLFEHMMFKGAKRYTGDQFDHILQANGATNNAFTTNDYTGYYEDLPSSRLELVMDIESDRMENLAVTDPNLQSEREVVKEERRFRVDNNPMGVLREALFGTAFRVHPYRWPVIGYMTDINNITLAGANQFYKTYYAPNNAVLVIAGDIQPENVKKMIEKYYGPIKSQTIPAPDYKPEPMQTSARRQVVQKEVQSGIFVLAYHTPKAGEPESYALDLLANILGNGSSSRLYQRMVYKDQMATAVSAYNLTLQDAGLFQVFISLKPGQTEQRANRALVGEMWRPRNLPIKDDEVQKAKNQVMKNIVDSLKTVHGKAEALALNETLFKDYTRLFSDLDRYDKVTPAEIRAAASKYLSPDKSSLVILQPVKKGTRK